MADTMRTQPFDVLLDWILRELAHNDSIFGIHRSLFYVPKSDSPYAIDDLFGQTLATPIGPAAGPHTQLAQNIVCAWLSGGRFIELKTVQIMDQLEIPRPCIDMEDEGYNVEWSQELGLDESAAEYVKAWVLIHVLRRQLGFEDTAFGTVFNMSVGYNLEGIRSSPMTRFMDRLQDASEDIRAIQATLKARFPQFADLGFTEREIPSRITNNVTLSTMHGCPPDEIERIARYLIEERGLHTTVKLNPTLLGKERVMSILHDDLGYTQIHIPDTVFERDLRYDRAVELIRTLQGVAAEQGLTFGVKLSNTLAMANHKGYLPGGEMYMSGRALYPITMDLFHVLAHEFDGDLRVSYSAGADALNVTTILSAGARPVTVASDLLKPGGYSRLLQYLENLEAEMHDRGAANLDELAREKMDTLGVAHAAADARRDLRYKKRYHQRYRGNEPHYGPPKVASELGPFDCIAAPCVEQCAVCQDVPEYAWLIAQGEYDRALEVILARNPLPGVTGHVCTHLCQTRCTRNNYDEPVAIRALKRFAVEHGHTPPIPDLAHGHSTSPEERGTQSLIPNPKVAVIGSGPSGLAAAYFMALNGIQVTIYEAKDVAGGMLAIAPPFRLPLRIVREDIERITDLGVELVLSHPITAPPEELLGRGYDAVYVACGFPRDARLNIEGIDGRGVYTALDFLDRVARGEGPDLGARVLVIGGGNTAMDAARTAQRLTREPATVVYRRTMAEMPAEDEELEDLFAEGNLLIELASPTRVILRDGCVAAIECVRNELGDPGADGRRRPMPIEGSEFQVGADAIILAIGQRPDIAFLDGSGVSLREGGAIAIDPETGWAGSSHVYAGGDASRGPAIIIQACDDGRRAAEAICAEYGIACGIVETNRIRLPPIHPTALSDREIRQIKAVRARLEAQHKPEALPVDRRSGFDLVEQTLSQEAARREAARCVQCTAVCDKCVEVCPNRANYTYLVSPVSWPLPVLSCQDGGLVVTGTEPFRVEQGRQIIHIDDLCNECGNCATFCVHYGKPYTEKPRLFLRKDDFEREADNAFYVEAGTIRRREGGRESQFTTNGGILAYENPQVRIRFSPDLESSDLESSDLEIEWMTLKKAFDGPLSLRNAAEMALILSGVTTSLPFLL